MLILLYSRRFGHSTHRSSSGICHYLFNYSSQHADLNYHTREVSDILPIRSSSGICFITRIAIRANMQTNVDILVRFRAFYSSVIFTYLTYYMHCYSSQHTDVGCYTLEVSAILPIGHLQISVLCALLFGPTCRSFFIIFVRLRPFLRWVIFRHLSYYMYCYSGQNSYVGYCTQNVSVADFLLSKTLRTSNLFKPRVYIFSFFFP